MIEKLQSKFSDYQQQLFLLSFYCYLKYDKLNDFVIDLDDIWEWLGFTNKVHSKRLLKSLFTIDIEFKLIIDLNQSAFKAEFMDMLP